MKEFEVALKIVKDRYRPIIDHQQELYCIFDKNLIIKHINEAYCRYFNKKYDELVGRSFLELLPKSEHRSIIKKYKEITPKNPTLTTTHKVQIGNKNYRWQEWKDIAVFDEKGELIEYQSIGRDVTEIKKLQEEIEELKKRFDMKNAKNVQAFIGKDGNKKIIINASEICYIKADLINIEVYAKNKKAKISMQIKEAQKILEGLNFFRVHRSYLVNLDKIKQMESIVESKYKIYFEDIDDFVISSKKGAKELRHYIKKGGLAPLFKNN